MDLFRMGTRSAGKPTRDIEARYRRQFECAREGMLIMDAASGRILEVNTCLADLLGCAPAELVGRNLWRLGLLADAAAVQTLQGAVKRNGTSRNFDLSMRRTDGQRIDVDFFSSSLESSSDSLILCTLRDITERKQMLAALQRTATTDCLTGVSNRWHFMEAATAELKRARRYSRALSLIVLDADHFKLINHRHGHQVGDQVLKSLADACRRTIREADVVGRIGGEEFAILMPETALHPAIKAAQRVRMAVRDIRIPAAGDDGTRVTASIGVATTDDGQSSLDDLLISADERLYIAKEAGGDQVCPIVEA